MRVRDITDYIKGVAATPEPRWGSDSPRLDEAEFKRRFARSSRTTGMRACRPSWTASRTP